MALDRHCEKEAEYSPRKGYANDGDIRRGNKRVMIPTAATIVEDSLPQRLSVRRPDVLGRISK
jgi:hypothetical protein